MASECCEVNFGLSKTWVNSPKTCDLLCCATGHISPPRRTTTVCSPLLLFVIIFFFFSALSLGAVAPLSWTSLCISKRSTFVVSTSLFVFFKWTAIKEVISLLPCFCCFCLCRFLFQRLEAPFVLFQPHYTLQLEQIFGFCSVSLKSVFIQRLSPSTLKTDTWSYLNHLAKPLCSYVL